MGTGAVSVATEREYLRYRDLPGYRELSGAAMTAPASGRWNSGDWEVSAQPFVSEELRRHLDELGAVTDDVGFRFVDDPSPTNRAALARALRRWHQLSNAIMTQTRPLALLDCSADALAWVEFYSYTRPVEHAMSMTLHSDLDVLRRLFPHWRRLCDAVESTDPETLDRLREFRATSPVTGINKRYEQAPILPAETERHLAECGSTWWDVAGWNGARQPQDWDPQVPNAGSCDPMALAFVVAERLG